MPPVELPLDVERRRRRERIARPVAIGMAFLALWLAGFATYKTVTRDDLPDVPEHASADGSAKPDHGVPVVRHVAAHDVVRMKHGVASASGGVRVIDRGVAAALGIAPDDTLLAISGHRVDRELDVIDVLTTLQLMPVTQLFVEIQHGNPSDRGLEIWILDGDLRSATADANRASLPSVAPVSDPIVDTITQPDDTHAEMPAASADKLAADPAMYLRSARSMPWNSIGGTASGLKLYGIRTGSVLEALHLKDGDLVTSVNEHPIGSVDDFAAQVVATRGDGRWTLEIERHRVSMSLVITIR